VKFVPTPQLYSINLKLKPASLEVSTHCEYGTYEYPAGAAGRFNGGGGAACALRNAPLVKNKAAIIDGVLIHPSYNVLKE
jgi:hypothetical protein